MKKISNFIVEKRNFIIPIFIILAIICVFTSQKVKINKEITEYLPSDSETRIGLDKWTKNSQMLILQVHLV